MVESFESLNGLHQRQPYFQYHVFYKSGRIGFYSKLYPFQSTRPFIKDLFAMYNSGL